MPPFPDKPRLLIVSGSFPQIRCGVSKHVEILASRSARQGDYDVHVLTSADDAVDGALANGYAVHPRVDNWSWFQSRAICRHILRLQPDVVHIQNPTIKYVGLGTLTMSAVVPRLKKLPPHLPVVVMQHDIAVGRPLFRRRYRPLLRGADAVLISNQRDYLAVLDLGINPDQVHIAPVASHMGVHPRTSEQTTASRQTLQIPLDALCIAYFGFVHPGRNIDAILHALHRLQQEGRQVFGLIMGGPAKGSEPYFTSCKTLANQLGLADSILWTGYASPDQIADGLAAADVFVSLPERGADLRNTSIQTAMIADLPIVTTCNRRYYHDQDLEKMGCTFISDSNPDTLHQAILESYHQPPSPDFLTQRRTRLDPETLWSKHVNATFRAYRRQKPLDCPSNLAQ